MQDKEICEVVIMDDKIATPYKTYWVEKAGKHPDYQYPCVMTDILYEIADLVAKGYELKLVDKTSTGRLW